MIHIKKYEEVTYIDKKTTFGPQIDDYVLCEETFGDDDKIQFIKTNIGQVVDILNMSNYLIKFENVPTKLLNFFNEKQPNCRSMNLYEIICYSKDKKELEDILIENKYNL